MMLRRAYAWLAVVSLLAVAPAAAAFKYVEVGQEAPGFALPALDGGTVDLAAVREGARATGIVFWATWSPRSRPMLDELESLVRQYRDQGFRVVAVNVEHEEVTGADREKIAELAKNWSFPVAVDEGLATYYAYGVVATPSLALLDDRGVVRMVRASYSTSAKLEIEEAVRGLLGVEGAEEPRFRVSKRDYVPPKKATLHYQKARVLIRRGMDRKAVRDLEKAARIDPKWADPRVALARIYLAQAARKPGRLEQAEAVLKEAREIQPRHLQTLALLADVLVARGSHAEALEAAGEALAIEPAYTPALVARARSLRALGRLEEAKAAIEEALELNPQDPHVLQERGEVAAALGLWPEAAAAMRRAVEVSMAAGERGG